MTLHTDPTREKRRSQEGRRDGFAKEGNYDLIVIGHSDHSELWGRLLGERRGGGGWWSLTSQQ